ncbi:Gfo/Idh/MocA family protein [Paenibacillus eucommiae]|uniref:Dehydrogenase n=1 Tax=Paenibacillus eucommiae TaxID=1355755 RepID=A0ABS4IMD7_9BACL|nr:Gfo/Idh/MocA family oxidoreductase [Paenibacillus eucommiae]MBP1988733.1 putative dehydrogenase [Paenibacillus eucommiae]
MRKQIKVGIVGAGSWAECHVEAYQAIPQMEVVSLCDTIMEKANETADRYGIRGRYNSLNEMLAKQDIDLISVATHELHHYVPTVLALKNSKHVVIDQPVVNNPLSALEMWKNAIRSNKQLFVTRPSRFLKPYADAYAQLQSGQIGKLQQLIFHRTRSERLFQAYHRLPTYFEMLVHDLDLAFWLSNADFIQVGQAFGSKPLRNGLRNIERLDFEFGNGVTVTMSSLWTPDGETEQGEVQHKEIQDGEIQHDNTHGEIQSLTTGTLELIGEKGTISIDTGDIALLIGDPWNWQASLLPEALKEQLRSASIAALHEQLKSYVAYLGEEEEEDADTDTDAAAGKKAGAGEDSKKTLDYSSMKQSQQIIQFCDAMLRSLDFNYPVRF